MIKGFKEFILRGNVIDLAVAFVIGAHSRRRHGVRRGRSSTRSSGRCSARKASTKRSSCALGAPTFSSGRSLARSSSSCSSHSSCTLPLSSRSTTCGRCRSGSVVQSRRPTRHPPSRSCSSRSAICWPRQWSRALVDLPSDGCSEVVAPVRRLVRLQSGVVLVLRVTERLPLRLRIGAGHRRGLHAAVGAPARRIVRGGRLFHPYDRTPTMATGSVAASLSRSAKCNYAEPKNMAAVRAGQLSAVDEALNIRPGPDTDTIGNEGRSPDGCHMNEAGTLANAALWAAFMK